jgi:hypothetical protein
MLKRSWKQGYSDFVLCNTVNGAFKYAGKYLMKGVSVERAGSKAVKGLAMCWVFRKRSFSLSGHFAKLYADEITHHSNSNKVLVAYKRLDGGGVLLLVTRWKAIGFMESEVVRWSRFQLLSTDEIAGIWDENTFLFR